MKDARYRPVKIAEITAWSHENNELIKAMSAQFEESMLSGIDFLANQGISTHFDGKKAKIWDQYDLYLEFTYWQPNFTISEAQLMIKINRTEEGDFLDFPNLIGKTVQNHLNQFDHDVDRGMDAYKACRRLEFVLNRIGWEIDYGLSGEPHGLKMKDWKEKHICELYHIKL